MLWTLAQLPTVPQSDAFENLKNTNIVVYLLTVALLVVAYVAAVFYRKNEKLQEKMLSMQEKQISDLKEENKDLKRK